jgi:zinc transport system permease protein
MQLALVAGLVVGLCAPLIGTFLVQKRMSLLGDGLGHVAFAGVGAGLLLDVWPVWTALVAAVASALAMERLRVRGRTGGDLALALFFYSGIAAGVVLASRAGAVNQAGTYLFGQILTVSRGDVVAIAVMGAVVVTTVAVCGRAMFATVLDEESARVAGIPVDGLNAALAALAAVTVVAAMRVVGILLVAALMVLPVASGQVLGRSFRTARAWSVAVGACSVVAGLTASRAWSLAPGGTIVLVAAAVFCVVNVADRLRTRSGLVGVRGPQLTSRS